MEQEKRVRREIANSNERRRMESINAGFQTLKALLPRRDGEKISKASILQQTAEFITHLQREKSSLNQQMAQYKAIVKAAGLSAPMPLAPTQDCANADVVVDDVPLKKRRKYEAISTDSSDEGLGGMTSDTEGQVKKPKVLRFGSYAGNIAVVHNVSCQTVEEQPPQHLPQPQQQQLQQQPQQQHWPVGQEKVWEAEIVQRQLVEVRLALDRERRMRSLLEEQIRSVEISRLQSLSRLSILDYPAAAAAAAFQSLLPHATYNSLMMPNAAAAAAAVAASPSGAMMNNGQTILEPPTACSSAPNNAAMLLSPCTASSKASSPMLVAANRNPVAAVAALSQPQLNTAQQPTPHHAASASYLPQTNNQCVMNPSAVAQQSRQSLEAIVEAIRHLEGDQLFLDDSKQWSNNGSNFSANNNTGNVLMGRNINVPNFPPSSQLLHHTASLQQQPVEQFYNSVERCVSQESYASRAFQKQESC